MTDNQTPPLNGLLTGYHRFRDNDWAEDRARWAELAEGQSPQMMVISCSDSRVDPSQIFDVAPGEIFVVRNVAALVPPYETTPGQHGVSAALEFAVQVLKVREVLVMGHGLCGGCKAALTRAMDNAEDALRRDDLAEAIDDQAEAMDALREGMQNLADQMAQQQGQQQPGQGQQEGDQAGNVNPQQRDPLGREPGTRGQLGSDEQLLGEEDVYRRAEELLGEIRRRSSEVERPEAELDYLRRLLDRF